MSVPLYEHRHNKDAPTWTCVQPHSHRIPPFPRLRPAPYRQTCTHTHTHTRVCRLLCQGLQRRVVGTVQWNMHTGPARRLSVAQEAEHAQQALWGGAGFCDYANECNCPDQDSCDVTKISACFSSRTPCQCACRDALTRAQTVCGATSTNSTGHSVAVNPPMCDPKLTSACTINSCKDSSGGVLRWSDKESQYKPTESNWGGDNQCVVNGEYSSTCSTSLADMNAEAKANYLGRMISGCRLGAERSCVDAKYQYDKPFKDLDSLSSGRRTRASAPACHLSLLAIVAVFLMGQRL